MSFKVVGECSICGGAVVVPTVWMGIYPPTPQCNSCHATARPAGGKVIPMNPAPKPRRFSKFVGSHDVQDGE